MRMILDGIVSRLLCPQHEMRHTIVLLNFHNHRICLFKQMFEEYRVVQGGNLTDHTAWCGESTTNGELTTLKKKKAACFSCLDSEQQ